MPKRPRQISRPLPLSFSSHQKMGESSLPKCAVQNLFENLRQIDTQIDDLNQSELGCSVLTENRPSFMDRSNESKSILSSKSRSRSRSQNSFYNYKSYCQRNESKSRRSSYNPVEARSHIKKLNLERSVSGCLPSFPKISTR